MCDGIDTLENLGIIGVTGNSTQISHGQAEGRSGKVRFWSMRTGSKARYTGLAVTAHV